jgi:hypothetical protein
VREKNINLTLSDPGVCEHQNVRGGHLGRDGTLANPLQQVLVLELLVAPFATLDNELPPNK